jgi:hypothetical protein
MDKPVTLFVRDDETGIPMWVRNTTWGQYEQWMHRYSARYFGHIQATFPGRHDYRDLLPTTQ